jgi:phospholipase/carboxylesterase
MDTVATEDLFSFATELPKEYYVIGRAPYDLQYGSYAWYAINFDANQNKFSDNDQAYSIMRCHRSIY